MFRNTTSRIAQNPHKGKHRLCHLDERKGLWEAGGKYGFVYTNQVEIEKKIHKILGEDEQKTAICNATSLYFSGNRENHQDRSKNV